MPRPAVRFTPLLSLLLTLALASVIASLLHLLILWSGASDLVALLIFAAPICAYLAYCTNESTSRLWRAALRMYASFAGVVLAAAGLVYFIG